MTVLKKLNVMENLTQESQTLHMVTAITIAYLVSEYEINLEEGYRTILCENLLPKKLNNDQIPCDMDSVLSYFPSTRK